MSTETVTKNYEVELTNSCTCTVLDDDAEFDIDNYKPAEYCFGDCYDMALDDINEYWLTNWQEANGFDEDTVIRINGYKMGWMSRTGEIDIKIKEIVKTLGFDGDWILKFKFSEDYKSLDIVRYSHDEPTGAMFTVSKYDSDTCEYCGEVALCEKITDRTGDGLACSYCADYHDVNRG